METSWAGGVPRPAQPAKVTETTLPKQALAHDPAKTMNDLSVRIQDNLTKPSIFLILIHLLIHPFWKPFYA